MRRMLAAAGLALLVPSAQADQLSDDVATLDSCLANATPWKEADACIGVINQPCQAVGSYSTAEMAECLDRESHAWGVILDQAINNLHLKAKEVDAIGPNEGNHISVAASLTATQSAWLEFRRTQCAYESHPSTGGSILIVWSRACFMRMTAERAIHLDRMVRRGK